VLQCRDYGKEPWSSKHQQLISLPYELSKTLTHERSGLLISFKAKELVQLILYTTCCVSYVMVALIYYNLWHCWAPCLLPRKPCVIAHVLLKFFDRQRKCFMQFRNTNDYIHSEVNTSETYSNLKVQLTSLRSAASRILALAREVQHNWIVVMDQLVFVTLELF